MLRTMLCALLFWSGVPALAAAPATGTPAPPTPTRFTLLGEAVIPPEAPAGVDAMESPVGGLSALVHDPLTGTYLAVSDDGATRGPARLYTLEIDLEGGRLERDGARVTGMTELLDVDGTRFGEDRVDPEGLALAGLSPDRRWVGQEQADPNAGLYVSSEGRTDEGVAPFVRLYSPDGRVRTELPVPDHYLPDGSGEPGADGPSGVRHNLGFESLTRSPDGRYLFSATENALAQDGPAASPASGSPARLLRWELTDDGGAAGPPQEWVYPVDPVALPPHDPDVLTVAGLVELLAVGPETLLSLERSYTEGVGTVVKLFRVDLGGATPVTGQARLEMGRPGGSGVEPAAKTLLLDLTEVLDHAGIPVDNLEGLTVGPPLPDGRRTILLISDDNFSSRQRTQVLAFAVDVRPVPIAAVQGGAHRSPLEGEWVREVEGVVTAVDPDPDRSDHRAGEVRRFWMQDPLGDDDPATSEGLAVRLRPGERTPLPGERVRVAGVVTERAFPGALPVTTLDRSRVARVAPGGTAPGAVTLPDPVVLGRTGRALPGRRIDDDRLTVFAPTGPYADAVDLWESLEGMRVTVPEPLVVGPTTRYGGFVVLPDGGAGAALRSCAGGIVIRPDDFNPERVMVGGGLLETTPSLAVGDRLAVPVTGVVDYDYSNYQVLLTEPIPPGIRQPGFAPAGGGADPAPVAAPVAGSLTVATYNVLNLHPGSGDERFRRLAGHIALDLGAPDLVGLQEIQDASGPTDDGVVAGAPTFERLIRAVEELGGPRYRFLQVDPADGTEGGQPGGNIRVGYLYRPDRLEVMSSARIAPDHPCFTGRGEGDQEGYAATRRPLAVEIRFGPRSVFVVNNHWKSKRGDDRLFGAHQPPVAHSEEQRTCQARLVADWVGELLAAAPDAWVIVLGDLNEHEFRPPLAQLESAGLENLMHRIPRAERYTYNFEGNSQVLDHILVSPAVLRDAVVLPAIAHVNADRPEEDAASDHEPVRVTIVPRSGAP